MEKPLSSSEDGEDAIQTAEPENMSHTEAYLTTPITQDSQVNEELDEPLKLAKVRNVRGWDGGRTLSRHKGSC